MHPIISTQLRRFLLIVPLAVAALAFGAWTWWAEQHPEQERDLRILVQERLQNWFPEQMALPDGQFGFMPRSAEHLRLGRTSVILVHGLDEPGGIWDELLVALDEAGLEAWEFRYPDDQAIDQSADLLALHWQALAEDHPVVLVGHSMGGLVIRDFVTRWRHPPDASAATGGAPVRGVILIATPNHGSDWARLRVWLELRELLVTLPERQFTLFRALRDGTGAAKIDLRPDSAFLLELNARAWPHQVPRHLIGGVLGEPTPAMKQSIEALSNELGSVELVAALQSWWQEIGEDLGEGLGDGAVPLASLLLDDGPAPVIVPASHRGLLVPTPLTDDRPPAIALVVQAIEEWLAE